MADSPSGNKPGIPAWQRAQAPSANPEPATEASSPQTPSSDTLSEHTDEPQSEPQPSSLDANEPPQDARLLLQQARKFLEDPSIRDAPDGRKRDFLRSKGVKDDDIQLLLADAKTQETPPSALAPPKSSTTQQAPPIPSEPARSAPRDIPPIVTYPEFLTQPTSPPPLITVSRVLNAIYAAAGLGAVTYGLSNYVVKPMSEELSGAREDFAIHTKSYMDKLNEKLESMVSTVPKLGSNGKPLHLEQERETLSDEESDEDPTELYHRDYGTQTSPNLSRRASIASSTSDSDKSPATPVEAQSAHLDKLTAELRSLTFMNRGNSTSDEAVQTQLGDLKSYLNEMAYSSPYFGSDIYGARYGTWKKPGEDDAIEAFKADIRSVKGVFLSSRNFPSAQQKGFGVGR
ncbi:peroxisomal membrane anchor protein conserved region-domain-containing protein [Macrophomina phaseolina]|uniref:Peroxisomal membrane protein PEX14 n=1 Tax=Macrophomina phaseolina TaxID=35725 RepID=A0ABQ8GUD2_9PEZI|nr:peroxisomal membrane anchor protein conserved region-domain-containing protein [Macrophomina phaseolina]